MHIFSFKVEIYEQIEGNTTIGSSLSPIITNLFMEEIEAKAINSSDIKPKCWFRYVDDTSIIFPCGLDRLHNFPLHLNNLFDHIKFTMEI